MLFCSQVTGQTLSPAASSGAGADSTAVETIRLAQNDTGSSPDWIGEIDIDPPVIDHEAFDPATSGETQNFSATVVDDRGLQHVLLFYRDRSGAQYDSVEMQKVANSDEHTASVDTALGQTRIEYYIEALDIGGNRVVKGFPFFPLVRELTVPAAPVAEAPESPANRSKVVYVVLGLAAVGVALALAAGGGGGDDGGGGDSDTPDTVPLNIQVSPP